ncbi:hypothetical protein PISMIDRAFT_94194 [Pisolithus microcarpus 441]|uniref:CCHC-type domain-containing protein n=1 Tax=Pisolithus microcarpus 441 TaxID=765257 RepID=A0A0C9ZLU1_9AGAM|nr:hypothetical protein PISMIDRAFT_94194 [Pisolithus microcarpus 441]
MLASALLEAFTRGEGQFTVHAGKWQKKDLDPGIDYLINASEHSGVGCQRKVFDTCFDNTAAESDHHECNDSNMSGCPCCNVTSPATCCDIHDPSVFSSFGSHLPKPPQASPHSCLPKYTKNKYNYKLEEALLDWHEDKMVAVYGWACLYDHGAVIMTSTMLNCIVNCAHHQKILTCQDLKRETRWMNSNWFGDEIVNIIQQHAAVGREASLLGELGAAIDNELAAGPLLSLHFTTIFLASGDSLNVPSKCRSRCSACGQEGHNARNCVCPKHASHVSAGDKENVSPPAHLCA